MRVLIVEDDENKQVQLRQFLQGILPDATFDLARSLHSGVKAVRKCHPDLIILDMTLPNFDPGPDESGGQTHPLGGREFLEQMARFEIDVPVVVVTQFETFGKGVRQMDLDTLKQQLERDYGSIYTGAVYYHAAISGWQADLRSAIERVIDRKSQRAEDDKDSGR